MRSRFRYRAVYALRLSMAIVSVAAAACVPKWTAGDAQMLLDPLFAPPTPAEREAVIALWRAAPPPPVEQVRIEWEKRERDGRRTIVLSHSVQGARHYGAIRIPPHAPEQRLPVLVVAHGGSRGASRYHFFRTPPFATEWIQVVPTFRSERLWMSAMRIYRSQGGSNPWVGDVEDAMALLGAVLQTLPEADSTRIAVIGQSRGGGVALLMGIRDRRVDGVVSFAAPTDFFLPEVRLIAERALRLPLPRLPGANHLADSVLFALRDGRIDLAHARFELLRRSPAWFTELLPPTQAHHGQLDRTVPFSHGASLAGGRDREGGSGRVEFYSYPEGGHRTRSLDGALERAAGFLERIASPTLSGTAADGSGSTR